MQVFRKYLEDRLSDPQFSKSYHAGCAICPVTIRIVSAISESPVLPDEIASQCDIPAQAIKDLETAEKCCVASVEKLCDYFGITRVSECLQLKTTGKE